MTADQVTCLIVDDEAALRRVLVRVLQGAGYACIEAASGVQALRALEGGRFQVVLSDIQMPEMDGVQLLKAVRERWPDVAMVMLTAVSDVHIGVTCLQAGAFDYITKPFQLEEVRARVAQALEKRRLILENQDYHEHLADMVQQQARRIEELFLEGVQTLVHALEAKDAYTRGHSARVALYAGRTARALALGDTDVQLVELGAELHDIGKIGVQEAILRKAGKLTREEYEHIISHTVIGAHILDPLLKHAPPALAIVRSHHERLDGRGLPDGLKGEQIHLFARIVAVADSFDAMTSERPYRPPRPVAEALAELETGIGSQYDRAVVEAFRAVCAGSDVLPLPTPPSTPRRIPVGVAAGALSEARR
ncbi:MAG TPA: HD domain-containing phosphohydrolase [Gemmatimonadales bacterium]|nr:HD domain-containing phosphohydrolase [Gemmatimonadales bacterium]